MKVTKQRKFNIFEGARRLTQLLWCGVGISVIILYFGQLTDPIKLQYLVSEVNQTPYLMSKDTTCNYADKNITTTKTFDDDKYSVEVCFRAQKFPNGQDMIPYKIDNRGVWGAFSWSNEAEIYMNNVMNNLVIDPGYKKELSNKWWASRWKTVKEMYSMIFYWVCGIWLFTLAVGWVVRGFLRIPNGQDSRITD